MLTMPMSTPWSTGNEVADGVEQLVERGLHVVAEVVDAVRRDIRARPWWP